MNILVATLGLLILIFGVIGVVWPRSLMNLVERPWRSRSGLVIAVILRVVYGSVLLSAAPNTRFPLVVGALGVISLIAAALVLVLGYERSRKFIEWWMGRSNSFVRVSALVAIIFGGFLIYVAT